MTIELERALRANRKQRESETHAARQLQANAKNIRRHLREIDEAVSEYLDNVDRPNWGHVGDLSTALDRLDDVYAMLTGTGEYAS